MLEQNWKDFTGFSSLNSLIQSQINPSGQESKIVQYKLSTQVMKSTSQNSTSTNLKKQLSCLKKTLKSPLFKEKVSWGTHVPSTAKSEKGQNWAVSGNEIEPLENLVFSANMNGVCEELPNLVAERRWGCHSSMPSGPAHSEAEHVFPISTHMYVYTYTCYI